jgi:hypothetical protein
MIMQALSILQEISNIVLGDTVPTVSTTEESRNVKSKKRLLALGQPQEAVVAS